MPRPRKRRECARRSSPAPPPPWPACTAPWEPRTRPTSSRRPVPGPGHARSTRNRPAAELIADARGGPSGIAGPRLPPARDGCCGTRAAAPSGSVRRRGPARPSGQGPPAFAPGSARSSAPAPCRPRGRPPGAAQLRCVEHFALDPRNPIPRRQIALGRGTEQHATDLKLLEHAVQRGGSLASVVQQHRLAPLGGQGRPEDHGCGILGRGGDQPRGSAPESPRQLEAATQGIGSQRQGLRRAPLQRCRRQGGVRLCRQENGPLRSDPPRSR